MSWLSRISDL